MRQHHSHGQDAANGFATSLPASGGAEPCTGSNIATRVGSAKCTLALAAMPSPPWNAAPRSVTMSPNRLLVTMTWNCFGSLHQLEAERVDVEVDRFDPRVARATSAKHARPQLVRVPHRVRLVGHVHARLARALRVLEGCDDDALDPLAGIDVLVDGDLVGRSARELAADVDVDALGVLAEHDEVDLSLVFPLSGTRRSAKRPDRADVRVEIAAEANAEQDVARVLEPWHARVAEARPRAPRRTRRISASISSGKVIPSRR